MPHDDLRPEAGFHPEGQRQEPTPGTPGPVESRLAPAASGELEPHRAASLPSAAGLPPRREPRYRPAGMASWRPFLAVALIFLLIGGLAGAALMKEYGTALLEPAPPAPDQVAREDQIPGVLPEGAETVPVPPGTTDEEQVIRVVENTIRSVVQVQVLKTVVHPGSGDLTEMVVGSGSGFVYDAAGHIITNNHVVEDGDSFQVEFPTGERLPAKVAGTDRLTDLAVLKVASLPPGVRPLPLADSSQLRVGQTAIAIGSPMTRGGEEFGLGRSPTVTKGIVSAVDRTMPVMSETDPNVVEFRIENLIQTDAAINKGNSGGPLLNSRGEVIGVNTAIIPSVQGIGFAIPANVVKKIAPQLIAHGKVQRPLMGIRFNDLAEVLRGMAHPPDIPVRQGALIVDVTPGGPADRAGLRGMVWNRWGAVVSWGDVIVAINDVPVDGESLSAEILKYAPGDRIKVTYYRGKEKRETYVVLGAR